ncbi:MAG TPA: DUF1569 domain-containing protein [Pyrinomonadaceae bacterium]|nr:DUF1569 domain-containing protein [Acidobacteriota bacterium]HQZ96645.1 DUF1569 domain-containing protein [Pyrinomonadaceae bacterium]
MAFPNIFAKEVSDGIIERLNKLTPESQRQWGKMDVAKMLAHCSVAYECIYEPDKHPKPGFPMSLVLKYIVAPVVVGDKPAKKNSPTGPQFIIRSDKDFETERARLVAYIVKTQQLGENEFNGKESHSFGVLNKTQWSNMLYKHLDHHLQQFRV